MTAFLLFAAALVVGAVLMLVPPLFSRRDGEKHDAETVDQAAVAVALLRGQLAELETERDRGAVDPAEYTARREELERRVLQEGEAAHVKAVGGGARGWGVAVLLAVPLAAAAMYFALGDPRALEPAQVATSNVPQVTPEQVNAMVAKLAARMEKEPDNVQGWTMLARSYVVLGRYQEAVEAFRHLSQRAPQDAQLYADWADALGGAQNGTLLGEPETLIGKALALDAHNVKALALAGTVAFEKQDYKGATQQWEKILALLPPDAELARSVRASVDEARAKAGMPALPPVAMASAAVAAPSPAGAESPLHVSGEVRLDAKVAALVEPDDTLFIFARPAQGGRPLAALRLTAAQLPAHFDFSGVPLIGGAQDVPAEVVVGARISRSGNAIPVAGDPESPAQTVKRDASGLVLGIDRLHP